MDFNKTRMFLKDSLDKKQFTNCAVSVGRKSGELLRCIIDDGSIKTDSNTIFDMASVTKILAVTLPALKMIDDGKLSLHDTISKFLDCPDDKKDMTILQLLTHSSGMSDKGLSIKNIPPSQVPETTINRPLVYMPGGEVLYICSGFMLLGKILELIEGADLNEILKRNTCSWLGLNNTCFLPDTSNAVYSNFDVNGRGIVHDPNSKFMGGIAGNAGVFSSLDDMVKVATALLGRMASIISPELFERAVSNQTPGLNKSRGLGFLYVDSKFEETGKLFSPGSFGHCGHTGTSMFMDCENDLYVVILTNARSHTEAYSNVKILREQIHNCIYEDIRR